MVGWDGSCWGENFNTKVQNWTEKNQCVRVDCVVIELCPR